MLCEKHEHGIQWMPLFIEEMLRTPEMKRLQGVSHSATSFFYCPAGALCQSKFDHSLEVARLAFALSRREEFQRIAKELCFAALLHDIGTPPFSHLTEEFMPCHHEEMAECVIMESGLAGIIRKHGCDPEVVVRLIQGKRKPLSCLIHGHCDIDSIAGMKGYMESQKIEYSADVRYDPQKLATGLCLRKGILCVAESAWEEYEKWRMFREYMYGNIVFAEETLASWAMLSRAIELAGNKGEIDSEFFRMTDQGAAEFLSTCNESTSLLLQLLQDGVRYKRVLCEEVKDKRSAIRIAGEMASGVASLPDFSYAVSIRENTGPKPVMPFWSGRRGVAVPQSAGQNGSNSKYIVQLFVDPQYGAAFRNKL